MYIPCTLHSAYCVEHVYWQDCLYHQVCLNAAELQQTALDKPIDLFKAIFENEDDTSEGEEASDAEQEAAPLQPPPPATAAAAAAMADPHDPQTLQQHTGREPQMELPRAVKTGEAQQPWAEASPMQRHQQAATERVEQPFSESQGPLLHQAAAPLQAPGTQEASELRRDHSSVKKRKHREEEKQKSHKKKHKKGKDRKSSGAGFAFADAYSEGAARHTLLLFDPLA